MPNLTVELPSLYGDHHVVAVRRLLFDLPGVEEVYASSGFRMVDVQYDPAEIDPEKIEAALDEAGYLGELTLASETGVEAMSDGEKPFFRHTAAFAQTGATVGFTQKVPYAGRPLWPCPGVGVIRQPDKEEVTHG